MKQVLMVLLLLSACARPEKGDPGDSIVGAQGERGQKGDTGNKGDTGDAGLNGSDGQDAEPSPHSITTIIDPCGDAPGLIDEVLLKMANGDILVYFTNNKHGDYGRLSLLPNGSYVTTDGSNCSFSVSNANVTY